jgi:uncharacterized repeat protein (TIGR04138 family)
MARNGIIEKIEGILAEDARFRLEAYVFIMDALDVAVSRKPVRGHVSGRELLDGVKEYGRHLFGPTAKMVFTHWGVTRTEDFGDIVFNLVRAGVLSTSDNDSRDDFVGVYDIEEVFDRQYQWKIEDPT